MKPFLLRTWLAHPTYAHKSRANLGTLLATGGGVLATFLAMSVVASPPAENSFDPAPPSVKIRAEEFFGVNDDDDNYNEFHDFHPMESPFLDSNGNLMADEDLTPARLELRNPSGKSLEGYQIHLSAESGLRLWNSPHKEYDLTHAKFMIDRTGIPRWQAPNGIEIAFPNRVFIEGVTPGSGMVSIILFDNEEVRAH